MKKFFILLLINSSLLSATDYLNDIKDFYVQGNELNVLHGAKRMLKEKRVKLIFTEISIAPNYKEQSEIDEVITLLRENEYKIFNFFKMKHKEGKLIECDILFYVEKLFV